MLFRLAKRCDARLPKGMVQHYHGRCDLPHGHIGDHVLDRGMDEICFKISVKHH